MKKSIFTSSQIDEENAAREELAYNRIKDYITTRQKRFIGACGYNAKRILSQCNPFWKSNGYLQNEKSAIREYLSIPSQTLKNLAGWYIRTSRKDAPKRVSYLKIIERLEKEGFVHVIYGDRKTHRANVYALNIHNKKRIVELCRNNDKSKTEKKILKKDETKMTSEKQKSILIDTLQKSLDNRYISLEQATRLLSITKYRYVNCLKQDDGASIEDTCRPNAVKVHKAIIAYMIDNYKKLEISDGLNCNRENDLIRLQNKLNSL